MNRLNRVLTRVGIGALLASFVAVAPAGASATTSGPSSPMTAAVASCTGPVMTAVKAALHTAAIQREATLTQLVAVVQQRTDPFGLNAGQLSALQSANSGIKALDQTLQSTCYPTVAALRAAGQQLYEGYRVYWLRVPQTRQIEAADRLGALSTEVSDAAARLAPRVGSNPAAQADLAAMNQQLATARAQLGTPPAVAAPVAAVVGLQPAKDMTSNVATMHAALSALQASRAALVQARADGLKVVQDLGG